MSKRCSVFLIGTFVFLGTGFAEPPVRQFDAPGAPPFKVLKSRENPTLDLLIVTVNVALDWNALITSLSPNGRMHNVGAVMEPIPVSAVPLIFGQKSVSGSPTGSPVAIEAILEFAARHNITPQTEHDPMSQINEAFKRLDEGKARYRIVLDADF